MTAVPKIGFLVPVSASPHSSVRPTFKMSRAPHRRTHRRVGSILLLGSVGIRNQRSVLRRMFYTINDDRLYWHCARLEPETELFLKSREDGW